MQLPTSMAIHICLLFEASNRHGIARPKRDQSIKIDVLITGDGYNLTVPHWRTGALGAIESLIARTGTRTCHLVQSFPQWAKFAAWAEAETLNHSSSTTPDYAGGVQNH